MILNRTRPPGTGLAAGLLILVVWTGFGCSSSSVSSSKDWSGNPLLTVTQTGDRLDLVGIDRTSGRSRRLAALPVRPTANIVPQAAVLDRGDGTWLLAIQDGNGFESQVLAVRPAARSVTKLGTVTGGRYPSVEVATLSGVGLDARGAERASYALPSLTPVGTQLLPVTPTAGDGAGCLVGEGSGEHRNDVVAPLPSSPEVTVVAEGAKAGGVACSGGITAVSLSASLKGSFDPQQPPPGDSLVVSEGTTSWSVQVGDYPQTVALSGGLAAVDIASSQSLSRAIALVDVTARSEARTVVLDGVAVVNAQVFSGGLLYVLGDRAVDVINPQTGAVKSASLPGENLAYSIAMSGARTPARPRSPGTIASMSTPSAVNRPDAFHLGELVPGVETVGGSTVINSAAGGRNPRCS